MFPIPFELMPFIIDNKVKKTKPQPVAFDSKVNEEQEKQDPALTSLEIWRQFLESPFNQIFPYKNYTNEQSPFSTYQRIKDIEFDRVLVILDDDEAIGFLFSDDSFLESK